MNIQLNESGELRICSIMQEGRYSSPDEVIEEALCLLARQQPAKTPMTEAEFKQELLKTGQMTGLPIAPNSVPSRVFQPLEIEGEPLSETIIRERR